MLSKVDIYVYFIKINLKITTLFLQIQFFPPGNKILSHPLIYYKFIRNFTTLIFKDKLKILDFNFPSDTDTSLYCSHFLIC